MMPENLKNKTKTYFMRIEEENQLCKEDRFYLENFHLFMKIVSWCFHVFYDILRSLPQVSCPYEALAVPVLRNSFIVVSHFLFSIIGETLSPTAQLAFQNRLEG
jgi:hypothetical protein